MWKETPEGIILPVKVTPKANQNAICGWENDELKVKVSACPEKGSANEALLSFLSKTLKIGKSQIHLISGSTSRHKRIRISGISAEALKTLLKLK